MRRGPRMLLAAAGTVAAGALAVGGFTLASGDDPPAKAAPLQARLATAAVSSLEVAPSGTDSGTCTVAAPCRTLNYAYQVASDGATINVAAGSYSNDSTPEGTKRLTFKAQPGNRFVQLTLAASNATYDGFNVDAGGVTRETGPPVVDLGGDNSVFVNGSVGNIADNKAMIASGANLLIDHTTFHDVTLSTVGQQEELHNECLYAIVVPGLRLTGSTFTNCVTMDAFFTFGYWWTPQPPSYGNVTVTGNTFNHSTCPGCTAYLHPGWHAYGLYIGNTGNPQPGPLTGWTVANNFFENAVAVDPADAGGNVFCGNSGEISSAWATACSGGGTTTTTTTTPATTTVQTTTTPPPPQCAAPQLAWSLPTDQTLTLTWPAVAGATKYLLLKNGVQVATAGKSAVSAKFGSLPYGDTTLGVTAVCGTAAGTSSLTTYERRLTR